MIEALVSFFLSNAIYPLIVPGLFLGAISILFSFFIPNALAQYKLAFLIGGVVSVLFFTFFAGRYAEQSKWEMREKELQVELALLQAASSKIDTVVVTEFVSKVKEIEKVKVEYETIYVPQFITKEADAACTLTNGFTRLHDSAARGVVPGAPNATDAEPSGVALSSATETITDNYLTCNQVREQLISLQNWIRQQKTLSENGKVR